jgi:hemerythrin-like domain-containing protein
MVSEPAEAAMKDNPVDIWHAEHARFGRLLDLLEREAGRLESGQDPDYQLMLDIVDYLNDYPEKFHHPREDIAFSRG